MILVILHTRLHLTFVHLLPSYTVPNLQVQSLERQRESKFLEIFWLITCYKGTKWDVQILNHISLSLSVN